MPVSDARPGRARHASVRLIAGHSPVRPVRCAPVRVLSVQQSPPCVGPATGLVQPIRLSTDYMHSRAQALLGSRAQALPGSRAQALPGYPCSPSEFRQALPADGADPEAPLKVVGLRGARAARAKRRTCFGRCVRSGAALSNRNMTVVLPNCSKHTRTMLVMAMIITSRRRRVGPASASTQKPRAKLC